ncbi:MAG: DUF6272 family protein [Polyangiaceae bacterium]
MLRKQQGIDDARKFAQLSVAYCGSECAEAAVMVVTELAENMVKYSDAKGTFAGTVAIAVEGNRVRVAASNEIATPKDAERVANTVAQIAAAKDVRALYRARLEQLFQNPGLDKAQLGLLRAAFEGAFRLSCQYEAGTLTITAERDAQ